METLIQTMRICSQDIGVEFSIDRWALQVIKSGKWHTAEGIELPNHEKIRTLKKE